MWLFIIIGVLFIVIGLAVHVFEKHFLISGYNTMSKEKKENVDIDGLARLIGIYSYANGIVFLIAGLMYAFNLEPNPALVFSFMILSTFYILIKGQKYDGNVFDQDGKMKKGAWKQLVLPVSIVIITLVFVIFLMGMSSKDIEVTHKEEGLEIHGMYGEFYSWDSIEEVELIDDLPTIEMRTNGSALGSMLKGNFRTRELGPIKLFVDEASPPFIYLKTSRGTTIFNLATKDETILLFEEILAYSK